MSSSVGNQHKEYFLAAQDFGDGDHFPLHLKGEIVFNDDLTTIKMFRERTAMYGTRPCLGYRAGLSTQSDKIVNDYKILTFKDCDAIVTTLAKALRAVGIKKGDCVGIYAKNSPYWLLSDFAIASIGAITCPLYDTLGPHKISYCIRNSQITTILTQEEYMNNVISISKKAPTLKRIINIDDIEIPLLYSNENLNQNQVTVVSKTEVIETKEDNKKSKILTKDQFNRIAENIKRKALPAYIQLYEVEAIGGETSITLSAQHSLYSLGSNVSGSKLNGTFTSSSSSSPLEPNTKQIAKTTKNSNDEGKADLDDEDVTPETILKDMRNINCDLYTYLYNVALDKPIEDDSLFVTYFNLLLPIVKKEFDLETTTDNKEYEEIFKKLNKYEFKHEDIKGSIDDLVSFVYTSGTSGAPKACCHSSRSLIAGGANMCYRYFPYHCTEPRQANISTSELIKKVKDYDAPLNLKTNAIQSSFLSFLPMAHIFERAAEYAAIIRGNLVYYYTGSTKTLLTDISKSRPTVFIGVPRVYTKIQTEIMKMVKKQKPIKQKLFFAAMWLKTAIQNFNAAARTSGEFYILDKVVFKEIQKKLGGNIKFVVSGSSALPRDTFDFLKTTFGGHLTQGFGCTETGAAGSYVAAGQKTDDIIRPEDGFTNPIGMPCGGLLMKVIDRSDACEFSLEKDHIGELCIKGPSLASYYFHETATVRKMKEEDSDVSAGLIRSNNRLLDNDGWYHTNDLIKFDIKTKTVKLSNLDPCDIQTRNDALYKSYDKSCLTASDFAMNLFMHNYDPLYEVTRRGTGIGIDSIKDEKEKERLRKQAKEQLKSEIEKVKNYTVDEETNTLTVRQNQISFVRRVELVVKTQQGEFIDLNAVEEALEKSPLILCSCVHATAEKAFPAAVIDVDSQVLLSRLNSTDPTESSNADQNLGEPKKVYTKKDLCDLYNKDSEVRYKDTELMEKINMILETESRKNLKRANLKGFCLPKAFFLEIDEDWTTNSVLMTSSLKKQHKNIVKHFEEEFTHMFEFIDKTLGADKVKSLKNDNCQNSSDTKKQNIITKIFKTISSLF